MINNMILFNKAIKDKAKLLFKKIEHIEHLNKGGCLCATYGVWLRLKKDGVNMNNINIVQLSSGKSSINNNIQFLNDKNKQAISDYHFALSVNKGKTYIDSDGNISMFKWKHTLVIPSSLTGRFARSALKYDGWNEKFDRKKGVEEINKMLNINMGFNC